MDMKTKLAGLMAQCLTDTWPDVQGLPTAEEIRGLLAVPPDPKMGDYALPVFRLAKALRMAPPKIATCRSRQRLCELLPQPRQFRGGNARKCA